LAIARIPTNPIILPLLAFPISYAPALMALIVLRVAGSAEQRHEFRQRLTTFRVGMRWYVVALWVLRQPRTELVPTPATT
jgi:hypothetical protein